MWMILIIFFDLTFRYEWYVAPITNTKYTHA